MIRPAGIAGTIAMVGVAAAACAPACAKPVRHGLIVERVVMVMRHGVRAPLAGEVPPRTRTSAPWPRWPVAEGRLTSHGAAAIAVQARAERRWLAKLELIKAGTCPPQSAIRIWTNTANRTIATGGSFAHAFAPGCGLFVGHLSPGAIDPLFEPLRMPCSGFDARSAITDINRFNGGVDRLTARQRPALRLLDRVLGCGRHGGCDPGGTAAVTRSADGSGIDLTGSVRTASGTAQVLLLQYAEGMPLVKVGWGRADAHTIRRLGVLHAALFDVFSRPPYMTAYQAGPIGRHILAALARRKGPKLELLVGHDTNVTALAAALRIPLIEPGYAIGDVAPGGTLVFEVLRDVRNRRRYIRLSLHSQSPEMIRTLGKAVTRTVVPIPGCSSGTRFCPLRRFNGMLARGLAPPSGSAIQLSGQRLGCGDGGAWRRCSQSPATAAAASR